MSNKKKLLFYIGILLVWTILLCLCSCFDVSAPEYGTTYSKKETLAKNDTINFTIYNIPYYDSILVVNSDSNLNTLIYNNHNLYLDSKNKYEINKVLLYTNDSYKMFMTTSYYTRKVYWCAANVSIDSIQIRLIKYGSSIE